MVVETLLQNGGEPIRRNLRTVVDRADDGDAFGDAAERMAWTAMVET